MLPLVFGLSAGRADLHAPQRRGPGGPHPRREGRSAMASAQAAVALFDSRAASAPAPRTVIASPMCTPTLTLAPAAPRAGPLTRCACGVPRSLYRSPLLDIVTDVEAGLPPEAGRGAVLNLKDCMADIAAAHRMIEPEVKALGLRPRARGDDRRHVGPDAAGHGRAARHAAARARRLRGDLAAPVGHARRPGSDGRDPIEGGYRLEVSSPGIDRPLTRLRIMPTGPGHEARLKFAEPLDGAKQVSGDSRRGRRRHDPHVDHQGRARTSPFAASPRPSCC